ncbi:MAG: SbcC/MukB-like Walker B domain-containing protein, partial [Nocardioidaceae bacterium]
EDRLLEALPETAQAPDGLLVDDLAVEGAATAEQLSSATERVRDRRVRLETLLPRERVAVDAAHSRDDDLGRLDAARLDLRSISLRAEEIPGEIAAAAASLTAASKRAGRHEALTAALLAARVRHEAAVELDDVRLRLDARQDTRRGARDRAQDARELLQDLVSRRLAGMAAELAGALVDGAACQVCGSLQHPLPATPAADAVTDADHDRAERELSAASVSLEAAESAVRALQGRHDTLVAGAGGVSAREGARMVASLADELAESQAAGAVRDTLDAAVRALRDEQLGIGRRQTAAAAMAAGLVQSVAAHERTVATFAAEAEALFDGPMAVGSLALALRTLTAWSGLLGRAERVVVALDTAQAQLESIGEQVSATAAEHGFAGRAEVAVALLGRDARDHLGEMLQGRSETEARVRAVLDDLPDPSDPSDGPASSEVPGVPGVPGVDALRSTVREAEAAAGDAARVQALHDDRLAALTRQLDRVTEVMADWAPVRDEALRAEGISRLVRGTGHDNQLQMRLSAYVLATRLDQVVAAANERLGQLRDQRYLLQRTDRAERRGSQAGLGLEIVDQWTGDVRSPSTLSGGETFVVSLSLALGLADVVTHESGGTEIETLFVDEGFGTLDADTLDDVMDGLDGLRAGGRTVGVVSHVTELRSRIPTQVQVDKGRDGSTVSVRTLVG